MRVENNTEAIETMNVCVMRGFYDEKGEYYETYYEDVPLSELPEKAVMSIAFDYGMSILYSKDDVLVVTENMEDIKYIRQHEVSPRLFHGLMAANRADNFNGYMCYAINLEALRKRREKSRKT